MAMQINRHPEAFSGGIKAKPKKDAGYLSWIHDLPCCVTGQSPVEAAHVSFANPRAGASGRGKSQKASDRFALPLHADQHRIQHTINEQTFWAERGIDPHYLSLALYGAYQEGNIELAKVILMAHWRP